MAIERRRLLRNAVMGTLAMLPLPAIAQGEVVTLVSDPAEPVTSSEPGRWAAAHLRTTLMASGLDVREATSVAARPGQ